MSIPPDREPETREAEIKRKLGGRITAPDLRKRKHVEPIVMLTAYTNGPNH